MTVRSRLLSRSGPSIEVWHHYDTATDLTWAETRQNCDPILDHNKRLANDPDIKRKGIKQDWWKCGFIPNVIIEKWMREKGVNVYDPNHMEKVKKLLMDPEWRYLKTTTGRF